MTIPSILLWLTVEAAATSNLRNPTYTFSTPGQKPVTLEVCNARGQCSTVTKILTVLDPRPEIVATTVPPSLRLGWTAFPLAATATGRPPLSYIWTLTRPDATRLTFFGPTATLVPDQSGTYRVDLAVTNFDGRVTRSLDLTVAPTVFEDTPPAYWARDAVEDLYFAGATAGCGLSPAGNPLFCPEKSISRAEMAVFLIRLTRGASFAPPAPLGLFQDVPPNYWAAAWIEQLYRDGITSGCGPGLFCPNSAVTRAEMAVFLTRARRGPGFQPPPWTGIFADVVSFHWAAPWIEQLFRDGVTAGCAAAPVRLFCPDAKTSRAEVAVFLTRAFGLQQRPTPTSFAAHLCATSCSFPASLPISFDLKISGGIPASYEWDWAGDGVYEETTHGPTTHAYSTPGIYAPRLRLRRGTHSAVVQHPPITIRARSGFPAAPQGLALELSHLRLPLPGDPPGTPPQRAYRVLARPPAGSRGFAAFAAPSGSLYRFVHLLAPDRATAGDFLLLPVSTQPYFVYLQAFTDTGIGFQSTPVRVNP